jgi:hypothetical protein
VPSSTAAEEVVLMVEAIPERGAPPEVPVEVIVGEARGQGMLHPPPPFPTLRRKMSCRSLREAALGMGDMAGA